MVRRRASPLLTAEFRDPFLTRSTNALRGSFGSMCDCSRTSCVAFRPIELRRKRTLGAPARDPRLFSFRASGERFTDGLRTGAAGADSGSRDRRTRRSSPRRRSTRSSAHNDCRRTRQLISVVERESPIHAYAPTARRPTEPSPSPNARPWRDPALRPREEERDRSPRGRPSPSPREGCAGGSRGSREGASLPLGDGPARSRTASCRR